MALGTCITRVSVSRNNEIRNIFASSVANVAACVSVDQFADEIRITRARRAHDATRFSDQGLAH